MKNTIGELILNESARYQIKPELIAAIIYQESGGEPYAIRYEPGFYKQYVQLRTAGALKGHVPIRVTLQTEKTLRSTSFGLMQIMGQTAREAGFSEDFLTILLDPSINIHYGAKILHKMLERYGDLTKTLLAWNGGGNPNYAKEVIAHMSNGNADRILYQRESAGDKFRRELTSSLS